MKRKVSHESFVNNLRKKIKSLKKMKEGDVHVFTVNANYGRYKIVVGPAKRDDNCPIEIEGEIHHLFISPENISPNPSKSQVHQNLKHTVIMRNLSVHFNDPSGSGEQLELNSDNIKPREYINLAGKEGEEIIKKANNKDRLSKTAYHIIQKDILHSLEEKKKRAAK